MLLRVSESSSVHSHWWVIVDSLPLSPENLCNTLARKEIPFLSKIEHETFVECTFPLHFCLIEQIICVARFLIICQHWTIFALNAHLMLLHLHPWEYEYCVFSCLHYPSTISQLQKVNSFILYVNLLFSFCLLIWVLEYTWRYPFVSYYWDTFILESISCLCFFFFFFSSFSFLSLFSFLCLEFKPEFLIIL